MRVLVAGSYSPGRYLISQSAADLESLNSQNEEKEGTDWQSVASFDG